MGESIQAIVISQENLLDFPELVVKCHYALASNDQLILIVKSRILILYIFTVKGNSYSVWNTP